MTSRNDITGDAIQTGTTSDAFRDGWERIFGKKKAQAEQPSAPEDGQEIYHLRSYGDVSKEDLDAYTKEANFGGTD